MRKFLALNHRKVVRLFPRLLVLSFILMCFFALFAFLEGATTDFNRFITISAVIVLGLPLLFISITFLWWAYRQGIKDKLLGQEPLINLQEAGFKKFLVNEKYLQPFTEEILTGERNHFRLHGNLSKKHTNTWEFTTEVIWKKLSARKREMLNNKFSTYNVEMRRGSIAKKYNTKYLAHLDIRHLENDLWVFTEMLKSEGFIPKY